MRASILLLVVLGACAADATAPVPGDETTMGGKADGVTPASRTSGDDQLDVCALAAALPDGDICQLACDPPAMAAQLLAEGSDPGTCYQLYCQLTDTQHVLVGVCLPPPQ